MADEPQRHNIQKSAAVTPSENYSSSPLAEASEKPFEMMDFFASSSFFALPATAAPLPPYTLLRCEKLGINEKNLPLPDQKNFIFPFEI